MNNSGFTETFSYIKSSVQNINNREAKLNRKRKNIWYSPPFSLNVKTNVGKLFFKILRKNFPKTNPLSKIFNKNTVKISYSCTRTVKFIISSHTKQNLSNMSAIAETNTTVLIHNKCLTPQMLYQADATNDTEDTYKCYLVLAEISLKDRYRNHI